MFRSNGIDTFYCRKNSQFFSAVTYNQIFLFHISGRIQDESRNLKIRETKNFRFPKHIGRNIFHLIIYREPFFKISYVLQLAQEPRINLRQFMNTFHRISFFQGFCYRKNTQVGRISQFFIQIIKMQTFISYKAMHPLTYHS